MWAHPEQYAREDYDFILNNLTQITRKEALQRNPWLKESGMFQYGIGGNLSFSFYYKCDFFDEETRLCTNHENRPPVCREFPWVNRPNASIVLPPTCSYNADVGREVKPVKVELRRKAEERLRELGVIV